MIGTNSDGGANHQYDTQDFFDAVRSGNFPTVSYIKAPAYENGHGNSSPLDEQEWIVRVINFLQQQPQWDQTAVIIASDDSDGWYDHLAGKTANGSSTIQDTLDGPSRCGNGAVALSGVNPSTKHAQGRCGPGPRLPLRVLEIQEDFQRPRPTPYFDLTSRYDLLQLRVKTSAPALPTMFS